MAHGEQRRLLHRVGGVVRVAQEMPREVVRRVEVREHAALEALPLLARERWPLPVVRRVSSPRVAPRGALLPGWMRRGAGLFPARAAMRAAEYRALDRRLAT